MAKEMSTIGIVITILAALVFVAFFLPWAHVEAQAVGAVSKILTGKAQANISSISGFDVPIMANSPDSRFAISVIKIFAPNVKDADKRSFFIWVVPLLAVAMAFVMFLAGSNKLASLAIAVIGIAIFAVGVYKINTINLNKLVLNVRIGLGLWLVFWGYLGIGVAALLNFLKLNKK